MTTLIGISTFILGTTIGSFLNVVILRVAHGASLGGRSHCPSCSKTLVWYELFPVVSFLIQRGRCRACAVPLTWQYPLVELGTGLLFLGAFLTIAPFSVYSPIGAALVLVYAFIVMSLLMLITVYDLRHKIVPNLWSYSFALIALLALFVSFEPVSLVVPSLLSLLAGPVLFAPFFALWFFSQGRWIGLGDGKLALGIGWFLGMWDGISALLIAFWSGALVGVVLLFMTRVVPKLRLFQSRNAITMKTEVPFAPFLVFGLLVVYFFGINVLAI